VTAVVVVVVVAVAAGVGVADAVVPVSPQTTAAASAACRKEAGPVRARPRLDKLACGICVSPKRENDLLVTEVSFPDSEPFYVALGREVAPRRPFLADKHDARRIPPVAKKAQVALTLPPGRRRPSITDCRAETCGRSSLRALIRADSRSQARTARSAGSPMEKFTTTGRRFARHLYSEQRSESRSAAAVHSLKGRSGR
jgi:hypothetical protein